MGVVMCTQHGRSGVSFVCRHVRAAVVARTQIPSPEIVLVEWGEGETMEMTYCTDCINDASLPRARACITADELERLPANAQPEPTCASCLARWRGAMT